MRFRHLGKCVVVASSVLWLLAACGTPATGSLGSQATSPADTATAASPEATAGGGDSGSPEGATWQLVSYGPADQRINVLPGAPVTIEFELGRQVGGSAGCNSYGGTYTLDGTTLTISELVSTEMACLETERMQQETAYLRALQTATTLQRNGDTVLIDYEGGRLEFTRMAPAADIPLEGPTWQPDTFMAGETAKSLLAGTTITATFTGGKVSGSAECNSYSGDYTLDGETITVGEITTTLIGCDAGTVAQEQEFVNALRAATSLTINGDRLEVVHPNGMLVFRAGDQTGG